MTVTVNGRAQEIADGTTVRALLELLEIPSEAVAVAIGREVVPRRLHPERKVEDGDEIEIVRAVGGG